MISNVDVDLDNRKVVREFILAHGTENQYERFMAGLLPESELTALARNHLFAPFRSFARWKKLDQHDLRHDDTCTGGMALFEGGAPSVLTHDEWSLFKKITTAVDFASGGSLTKYGVTAHVSLAEHRARCSVCSAETYGRSANIRIEWAGRPLSREYTLEAI